VLVAQELNLDGGNLVRMRFFHVDKLESSTKSKNQYCIAIDEPILTLSNIVSRMDRHKYMNDNERIFRYMNKLRKVFWMIGDGVNQLHNQGVVHGRIDADSCGKFDDGWKLLNLIGSQRVGQPINANRLKHCPPPEAVHVSRRTGRVAVSKSTEANVSVDIFGFGRLMFEVFTGKDIISVNSHKIADSDEIFLQALKNWDEDSLSTIVMEVESVGVGKLAADLVSRCLCPFPEHRPKNMEEVLSHPYWSESKHAGMSVSNHRRRKALSSKEREITRRFEA